MTTRQYETPCRTCTALPPRRPTPPVCPSLTCVCAAHSFCRVQWVNGIGVKRKFHKYGVLVYRWLNLPKHIRNTFAHLVLGGLYQVLYAKQNGSVLRMVSGVGEDGTIYDEMCLRRELDEMAKGAVVTIPDDVNGGTMEISLQIHLIGWLCDLLGAGGLGPYPESFSATHPCRDCWWHTGCWCAHVPPGGREARRKGRPHAAGCLMQECQECDDFIPRGEHEMRSLVSQVQEREFTSKTTMKDAFRERGINKRFCAIEFLAGSKLTEDINADLMHLLYTGPTPQEAYHVCNHLVKSKANDLTWETLERDRKLFNVDLPAGHKLPEFRRPRTDGKAANALAMVWTAEEAMRFAANGCAARGAIDRPLLARATLCSCVPHLC
jgi:hypothetical protein